MILLRVVKKTKSNVLSRRLRYDLNHYEYPVAEDNI
jgi:hypothetical protein